MQPTGKSHIQSIAWCQRTRGPVVKGSRGGVCGGREGRGETYESRTGMGGAGGGGAGRVRTEQARAGRERSNGTQNTCRTQRERNDRTGMRPVDEALAS